MLSTKRENNSEFCTQGLGTFHLILTLLFNRNKILLKIELSSDPFMFDKVILNVGKKKERDAIYLLVAQEMTSKGGLIIIITVS